MCVHERYLVAFEFLNNYSSIPPNWSPKLPASVRTIGNPFVLSCGMVF
jgi:hypothetical protein